jgi:hypothetical protein
MAATPADPGAVADGAVDDREDAMAPQPDVELRLARLEAEMDIQRLKAAYAGLCDIGYPAERLAALFTQDGVFDGGQRFGIHSGRDELVSYFAAISGDIVWALHYMIGPAITVDNSLNTAKGTWYLWQPCTLAIKEEQVPTWISGKYSDEYRQVAGKWLFSHVKLDCETVSETRTNWIENPFVN